MARRKRKGRAAASRAKGKHARVGKRTTEEIAREARGKAERGYAPTTAAGEFVHEEIHPVREGKHGAANPKQAVAIGLSKARRAGLPVPPRGRRK